MEYTEFDLYDTLTELHLSYRQKGIEAQLDNCPYCEDDRKKSSDHFSFNTSTGVFNCVKCNAQGNLWTFRKDLGLTVEKAKSYRKLDQTVVSKYKQQEDKWFNSYQKYRGVSAEILKRYEIGQVFYKDLGNCRTYPYYKDGKIVNIKYVNKDKRMKTEYNCERVYFGLQFIDFEKDTLIITEGEDDCMCLVQLGFENVVSIPFGAGNYSEEVGAVNSKFKKLILFFDNDPAGQSGAEKFSQKAGVWKCKNVHMPFKDARECLTHGITQGDMLKYVSNASEFTFSPLDTLRPALSIGERTDRLRASYKHGVGLVFNYDALDKTMKSLRPGEVMSIIADPGAYKTTLLMNMLIRSSNNLDDGIVLFFSLEMPIESEVEREYKISTGYSSFEIERNVATCLTMNQKPLERLYVSEESYLTIDNMKTIISNTEDRTGQKVMGVGIDYLDFVASESGKEYEQVKQVMNGLKTKLAREINVPVIILCQTNRASGSAEELTMRSGKGGTAIEAASDFMIGLWRDSDSNLIGRMLKHRRIEDTFHGNMWPYLKFDLEAKNYLIKEITECEKPVKKERTEDEYFTL